MDKVETFIFKELAFEEQRRLTKFMIENDVKFQYDQVDGYYVADIVIPINVETSN